MDKVSQADNLIVTEAFVPRHIRARHSKFHDPLNLVRVQRVSKRTFDKIGRRLEPHPCELSISLATRAMAARTMLREKLPTPAFDKFPDRPGLPLLNDLISF